MAYKTPSKPSGTRSIPTPIGKGTKSSGKKPVPGAARRRGKKALTAGKPVVRKRKTG